MDSVLWWRPGDCLSWLQGGATTAETHEVVVPCSEPHLVEIADSIHISRTSDAYPTDTEWDFIANHDCRLFIGALLGEPLTAASRYYATELHPLPIDWVQNHRHWVLCAVAKKSSALSRTSQELSSFVGPVEGTAAARLQRIGACRNDENSEVPCTSPHVWEVTGYVDLTGSVLTLPTDDATWQRLVGRRCAQVGISYLDRPYRNDELYAWTKISAERWAAGTRLVECMVERVDSSGSVISVSSSLKSN